MQKIISALLALSLIMLPALAQADDAGASQPAPGAQTSGPASPGDQAPPQPDDSSQAPAGGGDQPVNTGPKAAN